MESIILYIISATVVIVLFIKDRKKTIKGIIRGLKKLLKILPTFLTMVILVSIVTSLVPNEVIALYLGNDNKYLSILIASIVGSIVFVPGFIAFPLGKVLIDKGINYMVIASFTTTLMLVGILTAPLEIKFFGKKVTLIRNATSYVIALIITFVIGLMYGEVF